MAHRFFILSPTRSGSTMLRTMLDSHPQIVCHGESLNPSRVYGISSKLVGSARAREGEASRSEFEEDFCASRERDAAGFLRDVIFRDHGFAAIGFKLLYPQALDERFADAVNWLVAQEEIRLVLLWRRDQLRRYVSELLHAEGVTLATDDSERVEQRKVSVDPERFREACSRQSESRKTLMDRFKRHPQHRIDYEDIVANPADSMGALFEFLGVEPCAVEPRTLKVNSDDLSHVIANYNRIASLDGVETFSELPEQPQRPTSATSHAPPSAEPRRREHTPSTGASEPSTPAIEVRELSKCFNLYAAPQDRLKQSLWRGRRRFFEEFWALRDIDFAVGHGEVVGVIGANGSGKSTLLQIVSGILAPTSGEIKVSGRVAPLLELGAGFDPEFSGRENVALNATLLGLRGEQLEARYESIVRFAGIGEFIEQPVKTYSSGMYVRLAFAIAVHVDADILVIDEALAVGDAAFQFKCLERLDELLESQVTVLLVSHDLQLIRNYCNRVLYLDAGELRFLGDCEEGTERYLADTRRRVQEPSHPHTVAAKPPLNTARGPRFGTEKANIRRVTLGCGDEVRAEFASGERVWVEFEVEIDSDVSNPRIAFVLRDSRGYNLFAFDTVKAGAKLERGRDNVIAGRFLFDCDLQAGDYSVTLRVEDYGTDQVNLLLDKQNHAATFHVWTRTREFDGVVNLHGEFTPIGDGRAGA